MPRKSLAALFLGGVLLYLATAYTARADTVFEIVDSMSGGAQFKSYVFQVDRPGVAHDTSLRDFVFPVDSFDYLSLSIAKGAELFGTVQGTGGFSFVPTEAGLYTALVFGVPGGLYAAGSYGISVASAAVSPVPEAQNLALFLSGLGLMALRLRRRVPRPLPVSG